MYQVPTKQNKSSKVRLRMNLVQSFMFDDLNYLIIINKIKYLDLSSITDTHKERSGSIWNKQTNNT